jgi:hypothetical protein
MIQTLRAQRMIYSLTTTLTICDINSCRSHHFDVTPKFNNKLWLALGELLHPNTTQVTLRVFVMSMEREWGRVLMTVTVMVMVTVMTVMVTVMVKVTVTVMTVMVTVMVTVMTVMVTVTVMVMVMVKVTTVMVMMMVMVTVEMVMVMVMVEMVKATMLNRLCAILPLHLMQ